MRTIKVKRIYDGEAEDYIQDKIPLKLSIDMLNMILAYIISDSTNISRGSLMNIRKLFKIMDQRLYEVDYQLIARFKFIKRALSAKLDDYMENPVAIMESCRSAKYADVEDGIIEDVMDMKLRANDLKYVSNTISDKLSYSFLYKYKNPIGNLIMKLENGEYESFKNLKKEFKKQLGALLTEIRKAENLEESDSLFSLTEEMFDTVVSKTVTKLQSESNQLRTNVMALNETLNGGYMSTRVYLWLGLSGGFKSGSLLNQAYQIKQANLRYKCKDPLKRPAILYVTQENSVFETVDRLFSLCVAEDTKDRLKNYKIQDAIRLLRTKGKLKLTKDNNIDILVMYKPAGSIDTSDIRSEIENLAEEGVEVMCLIHDYIKKIRSVTPAKEMRHELGYIVDEFKSIAVDFDIPVLLANQLNRDASKTVDAAIECNKTDLARFLGSGNVSEAWTTIENADWVGIINRERVVSTNTLYWTVKRLKIRDGSDDSIDYFNHPFNSNEFGLIEDVPLGKSLSKRSLAESLIGEKEEDVYKFERRGETNEKQRKDKTKDKDKVEKYSLNKLEEIFGKAS